MKDVKIIIATHKKYWMPEDDMYLPLHVGAEGKYDKDGQPLDLGYVMDNTGENISIKNPYYCELTGLYWAWKNLKCDYLGLAHYRRHFTVKNKLQIYLAGKEDSVLRRQQAEKILLKNEVLVPKARHYYIESLQSHYAHTHYEEHLLETRNILQQLYPEYVHSFDKVMQHSYGYMFNMFIMKKEIADQYCEWLFQVLEQLEKQVDYTKYDAFQARLFGRVSELLFNVWLDANNIQVKELNTIHMDKINWFVKGKAFLEAKFRNRKFEGSF
ncbi:MAG: DUF4422 domain-containing protein [Lachnospiraceae bacterium]